MAPPQTHRTPLRKVSQGSLFARSAAQSQHEQSNGLKFLESPMLELADDLETLHSNIEGLKGLSDSLSTFNEAFASWLYIMDMNSLTNDWSAAPTDTSFMFAKKRAEDGAIAAEEALRAAAQPPPPERRENEVGDKTTLTEATDADATFGISTTTTATAQSGKSIIKPKKGKPKLTAKERKEREAAMEKVISCLPLEFRGNDPNLRRNMEQVISGLMNAQGQGVKLPELIRPDLNQARVNKCLIALVNRKVVQKDNSTGNVLYHWIGIA